MNELVKRIKSLSPEKRRLLEAHLQKKGISSDIENNDDSDIADTGDIVVENVSTSGDEALLVSESQDTPGRKVLKIVLQRDVASYLAYSLPLCIILAYEKMRPWYYQHFVQITAQIGRSGYVMLDYVEPVLCFWDIIRFIQIPYFRLDDGAEVLALIKEKIPLHFYVFVYLDEYHISAKANYHKNHWVHETMVYGYDDDRQKIMAVGLNKNNILSKLEISYDQFMKAFDSGKLHYTESAPYARYQAMELLQLHETEGEFPFDPDLFLMDFREYFQSRNRKDIVSGLMPPGEPYAAKGKLPVVYGFEVCDLVILKLQELLQGKVLIDYRAIHLLAEHKHGLYQRLKYVIDKYNLAGKAGDLLNRYEAVFQGMQTVRIKFMELTAAADVSTKAAKTVLKQMIDSLNEMQRKEKIILTELIPILETTMTVIPDHARIDP